MQRFSEEVLSNGGVRDSSCTINSNILNFQGNTNTYCKIRHFKMVDVQNDGTEMLVSYNRIVGVVRLHIVRVLYFEATC